ncbi:MAG: fibronectin type III domain-containing protein [Deltaproteobacteria bacterium]
MTDVKVTDQKNETAIIGWAVNDRGSEVTRYEIEHCWDPTRCQVNGVAGWVNLLNKNRSSTDSRTAGEAKIPVKPGQSYYVRVRATNAVGTGDWGYSGWTTIDPMAPSAPVGIGLTDLKNGKAKLTWNITSDGGSPITSYDIQSCNPGKPCTLQDADNSANWLAFADEETIKSDSNALVSVNPGQYYWFRVRALNAVGKSPWGYGKWEEIKKTPPVVTDINLINLNTGEAKIKWTVNDGGSEVTSYEIEHCWDHTKCQANGVSGWVNLSFTNLYVKKANNKTLGEAKIPVKPGQYYWVRVRATNAVGTSDWGYSGWTKIEPMVPSAPVGIVLTDLKNGKAKLTWNITSDGGSPITSYEIQGCKPNTPCKMQDVDNSPNWVGFSTAEISVNPGQYYWFRVRASNAVGKGPWGYGEWTKIEPSLPVVTDIKVTDQKDRKAKIDWAVNDGGSPVEAYKIQHCGYCKDRSDTGWLDVSDEDGNSTNKAAKADVDRIKTTANDGDRNWLYVRVRAKNSVGWGPWEYAKDWTKIESLAQSCPVNTPAPVCPSSGGGSCSGGCVDVEEGQEFIVWTQEPLKDNTSTKLLRILRRETNETLTNEELTVKLPSEAPQVKLSKDVIITIRNGDDAMGDYGEQALFKALETDGHLVLFRSSVNIALPFWPSFFSHKWTPVKRAPKTWLEGRTLDERARELATMQTSNDVFINTMRALDSAEFLMNLWPGAYGVSVAVSADNNTDMILGVGMATADVLSFGIGTKWKVASKSVQMACRLAEVTSATTRVAYYYNGHQTFENGVDAVISSVPVLGGVSYRVLRPVVMKIRDGRAFIVRVPSGGRPNSHAGSQQVATFLGRNVEEITEGGEGIPCSQLAQLGARLKGKLTGSEAPPQIGQYLGRGGRALVYESATNPSMVVKVLREQPADPSSLITERCQHFSTAEQLGIPTIREIGFIATDNKLYFTQSKTSPVNPNDPIFKAIYESAREKLKCTNLFLDLDNPNNWGLLNGSYFLIDP